MRDIRFLDILITIGLISHVIAFGTTSYFLEINGNNLSVEKNPITRFVMEEFGAYSHMIFQTLLLSLVMIAYLKIRNEYIHTEKWHIASSIELGIIFASVSMILDMANNIGVIFATLS